MTTDTLIKIATAALNDMLCDGCGDDGEKKRPHGSSCSECMGQAAIEIADRLRVAEKIM